MVHLDTSVLVDQFTGPARAIGVRRAFEAGEILTFSAIVLFEWLRGPRRPEEIALVDRLFPRRRLVAFADAEAARAAELYRALQRPRGREIDLAIAACALVHDAKLWTLNPGDFGDIPSLAFYRP